MNHPSLVGFCGGWDIVFMILKDPCENVSLIFFSYNFVEFVKQFPSQKLTGNKSEYPKLENICGNVLQKYIQCNPDISEPQI